MGRRIQRLNEQFKREITEILQFEAKDPRIGFVTITEVETAPDLSFARVHVSVMGSEEEKEESLEGLGAAGPFIRGELSQRLEIRRVPELRFQLDRTLEHARHIEDLLASVRPDDRTGREVEGGESGEDGDAHTPGSG